MSPRDLIPLGVVVVPLRGVPPPVAALPDLILIFNRRRLVRVAPDLLGSVGNSVFNFPFKCDPEATGHLFSPVLTVVSIEGD